MDSLLFLFLTGESVSVGYLRAGEHEDLSFFFGKSQLSPGQPGRFQFPFGHVQFPANDTRSFLR